MSLFLTAKSKWHSYGIHPTDVLLAGAHCSLNEHLPGAKCVQMFCLRKSQETFCHTGRKTFKSTQSNNNNKRKKKKLC